MQIQLNKKSPFCAGILLIDKATKLSSPTLIGDPFLLNE